MARVTACRLRFGPGNVTLRQMKPAAEIALEAEFRDPALSVTDEDDLKTGGHQSAAEEHQVRLERRH